MLIPSYLLLAMGVLGGLDVLLFHLLSHDIRRSPSSRAELVFHALRGPTYAALFWSIPNLRLDGAWMWALIGVLAVDLLISIGDFLVEAESRRPLGGLPTGEYLLHVLLAIVFGGLFASVLILEGHRALLPTLIVYEPAEVPGILRIALAWFGAMTLLSGLLDLRALVRLCRAESQQNDATRSTLGATEEVTLPPLPH